MVDSALRKYLADDLQESMLKLCTTKARSEERHIAPANNLNLPQHNAFLEAELRTQRNGSTNTMITRLSPALALTRHTLT